MPVRITIIPLKAPMARAISRERNTPTQEFSQKL